MYTLHAQCMICTPRVLGFLALKQGTAILGCLPCVLLQAPRPVSPHIAKRFLLIAIYLVESVISKALAHIAKRFLGEPHCTCVCIPRQRCTTRLIWLGSMLSQYS